MKLKNKFIIPLLALGVIGGGAATLAAQTKAQSADSSTTTETTTDSQTRSTKPMHDLGGGKHFGFESNATPEEIATAQTQQFNSQATLLGISIDAIKQGWAEGKTLEELANANGISTDQLKQKMDDARKAQMTEHLSTLVSQGVITQAQADQRQAFMETQPANDRGMRGGKGFGGN